MTAVADLGVADVLIEIVTVARRTTRTCFISDFFASRASRDSPRVGCIKHLS